MALPSLLWALNPENAAYCGEAKRLTNPLLRERNETRGQKKKRKCEEEEQSRLERGAGVEERKGAGLR